MRAACAEAAAAGGVVEAVNFNAPAQVVIAGETAAVERACEIAKGKGAKRAMKLPVSAPFHSSLLKPASDRLRDYMADLSFAAPQIPLINNVDVAVLNDPAAIKDALVRQAAAPVRWVETVQKVAAEGITNVIECGPGKVLMGLTKRIDGNLVGDAIYDQASLERVLSCSNNAQVSTQEFTVKDLHDFSKSSCPGNGRIARHRQGHCPNWPARARK
jgi:[acyl-carrier-protein] S-malonyltransferase